MKAAGDHHEHETGDRAAPSPDAVTDTSLPTRRSVVRQGVKLAFVAPVISTFLTDDALAYNQSCYPLGHACDAASEAKRQACCGPLTCDGDPGTCN